MPFIEDENGLAIYFTRDHWKKIYYGLADEASWVWAEDGSEQHGILYIMAKHLGLDDE